MKIEISYKNSLIGSLSAGESLALHLNGSKLTEDLVVRAVAEVKKLSAPTIEIADSTLNIYDEEGLATSYDILVDGEVKATVEVSKGVNITLEGAVVTSASGSFSYAKIKFGSAPTSDSDYDYRVMGGSPVYDKDGTSNTTWSLTVSPTAYVWQEVVDSNGGCLINGSAMTVGAGYANASQITLNDEDIVTLLSTYD